MFRLSTRSLDELKGVNADLVKVVKLAIQITTVDFLVNDGKRTVAEQRRYFASGASKTMKSKHLDGLAVDLVACDGKRLMWEWGTQRKPGPVIMVAYAMATAAKQLGLAQRITWGAVWDKRLADYPTISPADMYRALDAYKVRHPGPDFLDGPHFHISPR